jgi:HemY protein
VEAAWLAHPHPDLADAYAHVKLGDSARQRLVRVETLAAKAPLHLESALAVARAAIDASEFAKARDALSPFIDAPTQRVAMLMAEIERTEHGDSGKARAWTLRAVRALHDPVWTADGYVSDRWRPVSPVSGRLDAFRWQMPLSALPPAGGTVETSPFEQAMLAPTARPAETASDAASSSPLLVEQDNAPAMPAADVAPAPPPATEAVAPAAPPLFRARTDIVSPTAKAAPAIPPVIPIVRPPDDPGVDEGTEPDEFAEPRPPAQGQAGGWRGFLSRMRG